MQESTNPLSSTDLEEVFVDVRQAYRLLYTFQRRVMDTVDEIKKLINRPFVGGWIQLGNPRSNFFRGKSTLQNWAWDYLPMYTHDFHFGCNIDNNKIAFSVTLIADTGLFDNNADPLKIEEFAPVEASATKLYFTLAKNIWLGKFAAEYISKNSKKEGDNNFWEDKEQNGFIQTKSYPLSSFASKEQIKQRVMDFYNFCIAKNLLPADEISFLNVNSSDTR